MEIGSLLINLSVLIVALSLLLAIYDRKNMEEYIRSGSIFLFFLLTLGVLFLLFNLVSSNFTYLYVYRYTSQNLPTIYKISALWTGQAGSMLFLTWLFSIVTVFCSLKRKRKRERGFKIKLVSYIITILFLLIVSLNSPFQTVFEAGMASVPKNGVGMDPILQNLWMTLHPPTIFASTALLLYPFSEALLSKRWEKKSRFFYRSSWALLGTSILTGCLWSYETWQSYWKWDPAFTSPMMVWIFLTALLHIAWHHRGFRSELSKMLSSSLALFTFSVAIYSVYIIRGSGIQSLHSFGKNPIGKYMLPIVLALFIASVVVSFIRWRKLEINEFEHSLSSFLDKKHLSILSILIILGSGLVFVWGLTIPLLYSAVFGSKAAMNPPFFILWGGIFSLLIVFFIGLCYSVDFLAKKEILVVFAALVFLIFASVISNPLNSLATSIGVPIAFFVAIVLFGKLYYVLRANYELKAKIRNIFSTLSHLGIILLLFGLVLSTGFVSAKTANFTSLGEEKAIDGYKIKLVDFKTSISGEEKTLTLVIKKDNKTIGKGKAIYKVKDDRYITNPLINRGIFEDIYITYSGGGASTPTRIFLPVNIKVIPGMTFLWLGSLMIIIGVLPSLALHYSSKNGE